MPEIGVLRGIHQDDVNVSSINPEIGKLNEVQQGEIHIMSIGQGSVVPTGGLPRGGAAGDLLAKKSNADYAVEWITPATAVEEDNTRPITAAAVYTEVGNINALLATI